MNDASDFASLVGPDAATHGRYENWRPLGKGGTAFVFRVFDAKLQRDVAIKVLKPEYLADRWMREAMLRSLRNEVNIAHDLFDRAICPVHDLYEGPRGIGVVMSIVEGVELRQWMNAHANALLATAQDRLELLRSVARALAVAHRLVIHRDLKPENIRLRGGRIDDPVIMDFGISVIGHRVGAEDIDGYSWKYMAPEQYLAPDTVGRPADLWAVGIMAYELFTGRRPPCSLEQVKRTGCVPNIPTSQIDPPSLFNAAVPASLDRLILGLLEHRPAQRVGSAEELLSALGHIDLVTEVEEGRGDAATGRRGRAVLITGGDHHLGSQRGPRARPSETPSRRVCLTPFLIDPQPVTNDDYAAFCAATGHPLPPLHDQRLPNFGRHPVTGITQAEALAYARWVGGTLPTEAQWECAARGGVPYAEYPWGSEPPGPTRANIDGLSQTTTPVGSFAEGRNPHGLDDLCGNVWEWCLDAYDEGFYRTLAKDAVNPVNARPTGPRVLRGGSYQSFAVMGRCAFRFSMPPDERRGDIGFRVVYQPDP